MEITKTPRLFGVLPQQIASCRRREWEDRVEHILPPEKNPGLYKEIGWEPAFGADGYGGGEPNLWEMELSHFRGHAPLEITVDKKPVRIGTFMGLRQEAIAGFLKDHEYSLELYTNSGEKVPITKEELLENIAGDGTITAGESAADRLDKIRQNHEALLDNFAYISAQLEEVAKRKQHLSAK
ncbi:hypothetical protein A3J90_01230 [candidate division WOR-1 bacterium RIFOXYC2_FULL_37_10]|uniref:Uncharacterized protein n=1 Tax=candidate division WOR-1 bacterium RIFOXYB2_FULL_37_13 TaxID=1802579 RepID=A0A1F4SSX6_UNCSA|nr:MAG: hypothetical protein A2246_01125 [candidate division WOR-1 bacterium RIFOXYA2_FULL_37_7]OGC23531.1 MAG: hypothetical protein A2310_02895 [candidate division WOR-1 bacterium RIFOXYB2_FULL_37_13]OGC35744.1 MAG: hypothetical protein A3J90_01230 [candidate division WOR-1 bacterium RIFOXYC2_FULL_37_10]